MSEKTDPEMINMLSQKNQQIIMESQQRVSQSIKQFEAAEKVKDINDLIAPVFNEPFDDESNDDDELSEEQEQAPDFEPLAQPENNK